MFNAIVKYGESNIEFSLVSSGTEKDMYALEKYLTNKTIVPVGYNLTLGGGLPPKRVGGSNGNAKLTDKQALEIYTRYCNKETQTSLAEEYGVSRAAIHNIISGKGWKHLELTPILNPSRCHKSNYKAWVAKFSSGASLSEIGREYSVHPAIVRAALISLGEYK